RDRSTEHLVAVEPRIPYVGLVPFEEEDAQNFFGREKDTRLIVANLFASPLTLFYGASGVGKSSVLRARVIPELRKRKQLLAVEFRGWQTDPQKGLKEAIAAAARARDEAVSIADASSLSETVRLCVERFATSAHPVNLLMIILDQ